MTETQELLAKFVENGSESAFRELVSRYFDLVYSTAVRLVDGDTHRAEDVAQIVFADLARIAGKLSASTTLGGWLHRHTCFVARSAMRGERRRQTRERLAVEMNALNDQSNNVLAQVAPILDEAINELGPDDRDAILLRFFERRNLRSVGEVLGTTENVAQKRVARAVEELEILLRRRGVMLSATTLASGLAAGAVTAAPMGLALSIAGIVLTRAGTTGGIGVTSAKVASIAKLKLGIVGAFVLMSIVTAIFLHRQSKGSLPDESRSEAQQPDQTDSANFRDSTPPSPENAGSPPNDQLREARIEAPQRDQVSADPIGRPTKKIGEVSEKSVAANLVASIQRYSAKSGSKVKIEGTSNIRDWQVESRVIGGFLEAGPGFTVQSGQKLQPGPVEARVEVFIPVRSLRSVEKDGRPYSDKMDEIMYESLKLQENPTVRYRLVEMFLKGVTNYNGAFQCEFESHGELVAAGITNEITMPIFVLPLDGGKLKISGGTSLKMTSFRIDPPAPRIALGLVKTGDDVSLQFEWVVSLPKGITTVPTQNGLVPLILDLPAPAFKGIPKNLQLGPNVERLSDAPRAPMMVPPGLNNIAPSSKLTSSDENVTATALAKITDGDKDASDQSILFLRKGTQWVQMDLGGLQEIFALVIWHAHNTAKAYHNVIVQVANDSNFKNVRTIFNNDSKNTSGVGAGTDREYIESYEGKLINAKAVQCRYIRFYSKGSTESALNEYTEIEVYGRPVE